MKFEQYYSTGDYGYSEFKTILPFFGFEYRSDTETHYHSHGGDIKITHEYGNTYKVEKTREYESTSYSKIDTYTRPYTPSLEALSIESKFLEALSKILIKHNFGIHLLFKPELTIKRIPRLRIPGLFKSPITVWETPYIEPTLEVFHMKRGGANLLTSVMSDIGKFLLKSSYWFWFIIGVLMFEVLKFPQTDATNYFCIFFAPVVSLIMLGISALLSSVLGHFKKPLKQMSRRYTEKLKKQYYLRMRYLYGRKMGKLLKEYSILKESK